MNDGLGATKRFVSVTGKLCTRVLDRVGICDRVPYYNFAGFVSFDRLAIQMLCHEESIQQWLRVQGGSDWPRRGSLQVLT